MRGLRCLSGCLLALALAVPAKAHADTVEAGVSGFPRTASVGSAQATLLDAVLGNLAGTGVTLSVPEWDALATGEVRAHDMLAALPAPSRDAALTQPATLTQLLAAAAAAADPAAAAALTSLAGQVSARTVPLRIGDLLTLSRGARSLEGVRLNALELVTGEIELLNLRSAPANPPAATVTGAALGAAGVVDTRLKAAVVSPPTYAHGPAGTTFRGAAVRLQLDVDLVDLTPSTAALNAALSGLGLINSSMTIDRLPLAVELAAGQGVLTLIDTVADTAAVQVAPGDAQVFLGTIDPAVFFDPTRALNPAADVTPAAVGTLAIRVTVPIIGTIISDVSTALRARSVAVGSPATPATLFITGPFPHTQLTSTPALAANLQTSLVSNLGLSFAGSLGALLDPLANGTLLPVSLPIATGALSPALNTTLSALVTPATRSMGALLGAQTATISGLITLDTTPPAAPVFAPASPTGPARELHPVFTGTAEPGSTVKLFRAGDCTGAPVATGTALQFATTGLAVSVPADTRTTFSVTATDAAGNTSACSAPITYVSEGEPVPTAPPVEPEPTATPTPVPPAPTATPAPVAPVKPTLTVKLGGATAGSATVVVERNAFTVGCKATGVQLQACAVELSAAVPVGRAAAAATARIGAGTVQAGARRSTLGVRVVLNRRGRELLRAAPDGLAVRVAITGTPVTGAPVRTTSGARLMAERSSLTVGGFAVNGAQLAPAAGRALARIARTLGPDARIRVTGHTDGSSTDAGFLRSLGLERAAAVKAFLARHGARGTYRLASRGATAPLASNATAEGRARNRRVVLEIVR